MMEEVHVLGQGIKQLNSDSTETRQSDKPLYSTPEQLTENLDEIRVQDSDTYSSDSFERVREMIDWERINTNGSQRPWLDLFKNAEDYALFKLIHKEWDDLSTHQGKDVPEFRRFYSACRATARRLYPNDTQMRKEFMQTVFPQRHEDYSRLQSVQDWLDEKEKKGYGSLSPYQITHPTDSPKGGKAFYSSCLHAAYRLYPDDPVKRKEFMQTVFPQRVEDYSHLKTPEDWLSEKEKRGYGSLSTSQMQNPPPEIQGSKKFYTACVSASRRLYPDDPVKRKEFMQKIFPPRHNDYSHLKSVEDWIGEKERQGLGNLSTEQLKHVKGGSAFYGSCKNAAYRLYPDDPVKRKEFMKMVFSSIQPEKEKETISPDEAEEDVLKLL